MKITLTLNGKTEQQEIPTSWEQVPYSTFVKLSSADPLDVLCVLWGIDKEILKRATIKGFEEVATLLNFVRTPIDTTVLPKEIMGCPVPKDLNFDEVGRYWDIKMIYDSFFDAENKYNPDLSKFPEIVAIAVMPNYLDAKKEDQDAFTLKMGDAPCGEVLAIANFYLVRLTLSNMRTAKNSKPTSTARKSWRLGIRSYLRNLVITVRLWRWRKKLRSTETRF